MSNSPHQPSPISGHHESNLAWGPLGIAVSIVISVVAAMKQDLRALFFVAWPLFSFGVWKICKGVSSPKARWGATCGLSTLAAVILFGLSIWLKSRAVIITPQRITYSGPLSNESYIFTLRNNSDGDAYSINFNLMADPDIAKPDGEPDWGFRIPEASLRPLSEGANIADIQGKMCKDSHKRFVLALWLYRLLKGETREVVLIRPGFHGRISVSADVSRVDTEPQPVMAGSNWIVSKGYNDPDLTCEVPVTITIHDTKDGIWFTRVQNSSYAERLHALGMS